MAKPIEVILVKIERKVNVYTVEGDDMILYRTYAANDRSLNDLYNYAIHYLEYRAYEKIGNNYYRMEL